MDIAQRRLAAALARMDSERGALPAAGDIPGAPEVAGDGTVTDWGTEQGWELFHARVGFYPFGMQNGAMVRPSNAAQAPAWAARLMGGHVPPV